MPSGTVPSSFCKITPLGKLTSWRCCTWRLTIWAESRNSSLGRHLYFETRALAKTRKSPVRHYTENKNATGRYDAAAPQRNRLQRDRPAMCHFLQDKKETRHCLKSAANNKKETLWRGLGASSRREENERAFFGHFRLRAASRNRCRVEVSSFDLLAKSTHLWITAQTLHFWCIVHHQDVQVLNINQNHKFSLNYSSQAKHFRYVEKLSQHDCYSFAAKSSM